MVDFSSPEVRVRELRTGPVAVPSISPGVAAFVGEAERGPINVPTLLTGPGEFSEVFGGFLTGKYLFDSVNAFFNNGGERCYVVRVAHYTNIANAATLSAVKAATDLATLAGGATSGTTTTDAAAFPAVLPAGTAFDGEVDVVASTGFTIAATAAEATGSGATFGAGAGGDTIVLNINGVAGNQTIDTSGASATLASYLTEINNQLLGAHVEDDGGGELLIITDQKGSGAGGNIVSFGGAAEAKTGLSVGAFTNAGPNNVADDRAVTATEFAGLMDAGFAGSTSTADDDAGTVSWASDATGTGSSVQFTLPAGIATLLPGFDLTLYSGAASTAAVDTLTARASSEGAWANLFRVTVTRNDLVVATATAAAGAASAVTLSSIQRVAIGDTLSFTKGADVQRSVITGIDTATSQVQLSPAVVVPLGGYTGVEEAVAETFDILVIDSDGLTRTAYRNLRMSALAGSKYAINKVNNTQRGFLELVDLGVAVAADNRPAAVTSTLLGADVAGSDGGTVVDTDFIGSSISGLGLNSLDDNDDFILMAVPGRTSVAMHQGIASYVESRKDVFDIMEIPQGYTPTEARAHVLTDANLATSFAAIYYPWVRAVDPRTSGPSSFPPSGYVAGVFARTFAERNFGKAPAGIDDGRLLQVTGLDTEVKKTAYDTLYPVKINALQQFKGKGIAVMGSRTLDSQGQFLQINTRMIFIVVKRVFREGTQFALFENSGPELWGRISRFMTGYLRGLRRAGILQGATDAEAFFVLCNKDNNPASVRASGKVVCRVGIYTPNTTEFLDITLEQDTRALDAEIATDLG